MAHPPPRPASSHRAGASQNAVSPSSSGPRAKEAEKQAGTFFLGRYRVVDEIGVGGMASVHLGRMDGPGGFQKWVAIKRIHPHLVEDDQFVDMFLDEARIAAGINHANVAQVFDLGKDDNTYWIAMEYLHGEPLREVMRRAEDRRSLVSPELAARICSDAAEGLHAAHELRGKNNQLLGLVHRDVTPHNLFLTYDGYTKVVDFGIAKVADRLSSTRAGTLKGKLAYMSPEQVRGAEVDRTTDIFALGVVLWELTTNHRLFRMDTDLDTLEKVQACVVPPPSSIVPDYPVELESVVMKALAKRKQDRFQTAREFARALQNFLMRRGAFVGPEEVAHFVRDVFSDRIQKREAHLAWAAEVTSTINVDALRAGQADLPGSAEELSLVSYSERDPMVAKGGAGSGRRGAEGGRSPTDNRGRPPLPVPTPSVPQAQPMSSGAYPAARSPPMGPAGQRPNIDVQQMAATSLMDDDEDVPTAVATRDHLEQAGMRAPAPPSMADRAGPRPAAGMPAMQSPGPARAPFGTQPTVATNVQQGHYAQPFPSISDEHTAALPGGEMGMGGGDDLGATIALPQSSSSGKPAGPLPGNPQQGGFQQQYPQQQQQQQQQQQHQQQQQQRQQQQQQQQQQQFNGQQGFAQYGANGGYQANNAPQQAPQAPSNAAFPPQMQMLQMPPQGLNQPQSQVETALSLPRPDPAALWLAQQEASQGQRKNTGVLIAVGVLTALCVTGIGALAYFKFRPPPEPPTTTTAIPETTAAPPPTAPPSEPTAAPTTEPTTTPSAEPSGAAIAPTAAPTTPKTPSTGALPTPPPSTTATAAGSAKDPAKEKEEPGFLTIVCTPFCDDVSDGGRSLGPSPVVRVPVKPGQHRITLKRAGQPNKVISVIVVSGQVAAQRVSMK